jgi:hypothetical protein
LGQLVAEVLETWRKSDRRAADLPSGTHEQVGARWAADELRAPYHGLTVEGMANGPGAGRAAAHQDPGEPCGQRLTAPAGSWTPAPEIAAAHASLCSSGALSFSPDGPAQLERLWTPLKARRSLALHHPYRAIASRVDRHLQGSGGTADGCRGQGHDLKSSLGAGRVGLTSGTHSETRPDHTNLPHTTHKSSGRSIHSA